MFWKVALSVFITCVFSSVSMAADLKVVHTDPAWTGDRVPDKGKCKKHWGKGLSPAIKVSGIPAGTVKLELHFTDKQWQGEGWHGVVGFKVPAGSTTVDVPSFQGDTDEVPATIESIKTNSYGGVYLGPCSGGQMHDYTVTIYAKSANGDKLAKGKLKLGYF